MSVSYRIERPAGILDAMETERFFAELGKRLDEAREANRMGRTIIELCAPEEGPNGWFIAVSSPIEKSKMAIGNKKRRDHLDKVLQVRLPPGASVGNDWCPWKEELHKDKRDWDSHLWDLHQECKEKDGEITKYFVGKFTKFAVTTIPIIDKIEGVP